MFTAQDVAKLREKTGAGMMDCKKALTDTKGNMDKAAELLREKGIATAGKREGKIASQGIVDSYIHMDGKIGVLLEVNCETDFVARSAQFTELAHNICLQIAAAKPLYVSIEEIPADIVAKERDIAKAQVKNDPKSAGKPDAIIDKMVDGKINKFYKEVCLLEQEYVKDPSKAIKQLVTDAIGAIGEKITVRRFVRFERGEGLEKKVENFAEEVMSQMKK